MSGLVAEIAERVKRPHNLVMRRLGNWFGNGFVLGARSGRRGALTLIASAVFSVACGSRPPPPGYAGDDARAFVREHRAELEKEIALGSGPRIHDLAIVANCQDVPELGRRLRQRRDDFFSNRSDSENKENLPAGTAAASAGVPDADVAERVVRFMQDRREFRCLDLDLTRQNEFSAGRRHIGPRRSATTARGGTP
jgi:hypothetical protein